MNIYFLDKQLLFDIQSTIFSYGIRFHTELFIGIVMIMMTEEYNIYPILYNFVTLFMK